MSGPLAGDRSADGVTGAPPSHHAAEGRILSDGGRGPHRVALLGDGPAVTAVEAALDDAGDVEIARDGIDAIEGAALAVVAGVPGAGGFAAANRAATAAGIPWIAVYAGGIADRELHNVAAAVAGFAPGQGCQRCCALRLDAATDAAPGAAETDGAEDADPAATVDDGPSVPTTRADLRLAGALAGREAVRSLAGEPFAGILELPHRRRRLLPVPGCPVCGTTDRDRSLPRGGEAVDLETAAARAERAVDDRLGPVTVVGERESYPAPYYLAGLAATDGFSDASAPRHAAGVDAGWDAAYVKAVGEALERYAAGVYRTEAFDRAPASAVTDRVDPEAFVAHGRGGHAGVDAETPIHWVPGEALATGDAVRLPAGFVHYPPPDDGLGPAITTGLALGTSVDGALAAGLLEVIERDAAMLAWYSTDEPPALSVAPAAVDELARRAGSEGLSVSFRLLTRDVDVPVVAATVVREEWPRFAAGTAADLDANEAARSALAEAIQNWMELRSLGPERADEAGAGVARYAETPGPAGELFDAVGAAPGHSDPGAADGPPVVDAADVGTDVADPSTAVDTLLDRATGAGLACYGARLTTRDLDGLGFEAVRVLAPAAQPLFVDDAFFGERARSVPRDLGAEPALDRAYHPFP